MSEVIQNDRIDSKPEDFKEITTGSDDPLELRIQTCVSIVSHK